MTVWRNKTLYHEWQAWVNHRLYLQNWNKKQVHIASLLVNDGISIVGFINVLLWNQELYHFQMLCKVTIANCFKRYFSTNPAKTWCWVEKSVCTIVPGRLCSGDHRTEANASHSCSPGQLQFVEITHSGWIFRCWRSPERWRPFPPWRWSSSHNSTDKSLLCRGRGTAASRLSENVPSYLVLMMGDDVCGFHWHCE